MNKNINLLLTLIVFVALTVPETAMATQGPSLPAKAPERTSKIPLVASNQEALVNLTKDIVADHKTVVEQLKILNKKLEELSIPIWRQVALVILGGLLAAIAGIVAPMLADKFFYTPRLRIEILDSNLEYFVPEELKKDNVIIKDTAIYCHLKCVKFKGRSPAKNISVLLNDVFQEDKTGRLISTFDSGPIPLHRQYEFVNRKYFHPFPTLRDIPIHYDLARLSKHDKELKLQTHVALPKTTFKLTSAGKIVATVTGESDETVSKKKHIKIEWNGLWPETEGAIGTCLKFKEISDEDLEKLKTAVS